MLALAFLLWRMSSPAGSSWQRYVVTVSGVLLIYFGVSSYLRQSLLERESIRSGMTADELVNWAK